MQEDTLNEFFTVSRQHLISKTAGQVTPKNGHADSISEPELTARQQGKQETPSM